MKLLAALAALLLASLPLNSTLYFDGMPPKRYQGNVRVLIATVDNLNGVCGQPPPGKFWYGCTRGITVFVNNPCLSGSQEYARILCHEFGHINQWPATHGD